MATPTSFNSDILKQMVEALESKPTFTDMFASKQQLHAISTYTYSIPSAPAANPILGDVVLHGMGFSKITVLPTHYYRQPDKPLKSRGKRKSVRARRQIIRRGIVAKYGPFPKRKVVRNGRRIRSIKGLSPNVAYMVDTRMLGFERMAMRTLMGT